MKLAALLAILSLSAALNMAYATENEEDTNAYCNEQAEMAGIEDAGEKAQYMNECIDSFAIPSDDMPAQE